VLTADDAAKRAAKTAPSVARAEAVARRAALAASEANIAVYPRLELEARYTLLSEVPAPDFPGAPPVLAEAFETQQHTGLLQARLSYPVSALFFSIIPRHKAAKKLAEAQKLQSVVQAQSVSLQAREAFYNYARARAALMVAKSAQNQVDARRRDVDALVNAGSLARVELMRADAQVAAAKVAVSRTEGSVAVARSALFTLTHYDGTEDVTINEDFEAELPALSENGDALLAKALANRTELKALRVSLDALEHNVDAAQGQELPQLVVGGSADYANPNQRYFGAAKEWNESWALFASVSWSPNDWRSNSSVADQIRAETASTLADLEQLEDALQIEVTQAVEDYNAARAALESSRAGIAAATESYRVRREQFRAGAAVATEVIDSEGELRTARLDLVNAVIDARIAKARLDRAIEAP
jgi:outer membrane protein TolC